MMAAASASSGQGQGQGAPPTAIRHAMFSASPLNAGAHAEMSRAKMAFNDAREEAWYRDTYESNSSGSGGGGGSGGSSSGGYTHDGGGGDDVHDPLRGTTASSGAKYVACWGCGKEGPPLKLCKRCLSATYCSRCVGGREKHLQGARHNTPHAGGVDSYSIARAVWEKKISSTER
jgi:hypothetical protein